MFGSAILDVAIALIFIYFLLSAVASHINELVAGWLKWRAKDLETGIQKMLGEPGFATKVMSNPMIQSLAQGGKPSYLPAATFALALLDTVGPAVLKNPAVQEVSLDAARAQVSAMPANPSRDTLLMLINDAKNDPEKLKTSVEGWYNSTMDRVSGVYKRRIQIVTLVVSLAITLIFGADTIAIANSLYTQPALRAAIGATVQGGVTQPANTQTVAQTLAQYNLPLGWNSLPDTAMGWLQRVVGLLITALAVSLGAPFWFDILKNFTNPRSTGPVPSK